MEGQSNSRGIYNIFAQNWIVSSIITIAPIILGVLDDSYVEGSRGKVTVAILLTVSIIFTILRNICISINQKKKENTDIYYQHILNTDASIRKRRKEDILDIISRGEYKNIVKKPLKPYNNTASRINPYKHIKGYCDNIENILVKDFDTIEDDVGICIFYINTIDKKKNNRWEVLYSSYNRHDGNPNMVIMQYDTAFAYVKDDIGKVYFREKSEAAKEFCYRPSPDEKIYGLHGNIYCKNISICYKNINLPLVFCLSTYRSKICCDEDLYAKEKIEEFLGRVEDNIQCELINLMLYKHMGFSKKFIGGKNEESFGTLQI